METEILPESKKSRGHKCYFCGNRFGNVHILRKHVNTHKDRDMECEICGKAYSSQCGLKKHMMIHTGERPFSCRFCEKTFVQKCTMLSHIRCRHNSSQPKYSCSSCGKRMRSNGEDDKRCWFCKYTDNSDNEPKDTGLNADFWIPSAEEVDDVCEPEIEINESFGTTNLPLEVIDRNDSLKQGLAEIRTVTCLMCSETFTSVIDLRQHALDVHKNSRLFVCEVCGNRFSTQMALTNHVLTHKEERPFTCLMCGKSFKSQLTLQCHLNTHREDRPFTCKSCDASFKSLLSLRMHAITHQTERPFVCKQCGYPFKTMDHLKKHVIVHSDERPYKCHTCSKEFKHPGNLGRHYYLHIGQRLFICRICGKDFAQSGGLKQHEQVHNKQYEKSKKLSCPLCNKAYKLEVMLQRHLVNHP